MDTLTEYLHTTHEHLNEDNRIVVTIADDSEYGCIQWGTTDAQILLHCNCGHVKRVAINHQKLIACSRCKQVYKLGEVVELIAVRGDDEINKEA